MPMERFLEMPVRTRLAYMASAEVECDRREAARNKNGGKGRSSQQQAARAVSDAELMQYMEQQG